MKKVNRTTFLNIIMLMSLALTLNAQEASIRQQVKTQVNELSGDHPRLFLNDATLRTIKKNVSQNAVHRTAFDQLIQYAEKVLDQDPVEREKRGRRLLHVSRKAFRRVTRLALAHRLTGRDRFLKRATREMLAAANFSDWNPGHFLDVAEMTGALALGYDWLYEDLSGEQRETIRSAIVEKGLKPGMEGGWWVNTTNNWNQVCHGGLTLGALAVAKRHPDLSERIISRAVQKIPRAMKQYAPDGAYPEGPSYWGYGTTYNVLFLSALESAFDTDFGLSEIEGFMQGARYYLHVRGPSGYMFNYSDGSRHPNVTPAVLWFVREQNAPELAYWILPRLKRGATGGRSFPFVFFWGSTLLEKAPTPDQNHWSGNGKTPVGFHRTGWTEEDSFLAMKGGSPSTNHAHMDIGTFVFDAKGVRWATDLGSQSYHDLESAGVDLWNSSQDSERWTVFRLNNFSHNTLVVNEQKQTVDGHAPITRFDASFPRAHTIVDMGPVYEDQLEQAHRGVALLETGSALVQDDLVAPDREISVRWGMVTRAKVQLKSPRTAVLKKEGKSILFRVMSPESADLEIYNTANPPRDYDAPNKGTRMIGFRVTLPPGTSKTLAVQLDPSTGDVSPPELKPMSDW